MPTFKNPDNKGDLYIVLEVEMPDAGWLRSVDNAALARLLPPKKAHIDPAPEVIDEAPFEEADLEDFGGSDGDEWEDEDDDDYDDHEMGGEPECRPQ